ncbi:MAG: DUF3943 domain-containing protein [Oligoflexia bacterium]|nr:DUF3943 domain-containing protein [Oligoflexia bacterium]
MKSRLFLLGTIVTLLPLMAVNFPGKPAKALDLDIPRNLTDTRQAVKDITRKVVITVGSYRPLSDHQVQETCTLVHSAFNSSGAIVDSNCLRTSGSLIDPDVKEARASGVFQYRLDVQRVSREELVVSVENWRREDGSDFERVGWKLKDDGTGAWETKLYKLASQVMGFDLKKSLIKETLLAHATYESRKVGLGRDGGFIDKATGVALQMKDAYRAVLNEGPKQRNYLRAGVEMAVVMGFAMYKYYDLVSNQLDYDYDFGEGLRKKLITMEAVLYDDNDLAANAGHAFAGMVYYQVARSNNFGPMESFLFATASSAFWEVIGEYHEVMSINDMIITPIGGYVIGEAMYQMGRVIRARNKSLGGYLLSAILDTPGAIGAWRDRDAAPGTTPEGFNADSWARLDLSAGLASLSRKRGRTGVNAVELGFEGKMVDIPLYDEPGQEQRVVTSTALAELLASGAASSKGGEYFKFMAKTAFGVYYEKNLGRDTRGQLQGYTFLFGPASAVDFEERPGATGPLTDETHEYQFVGTINMIGPTLDFTAYRNGMKLHLVMDFYADFAMVRSFALDEYLDAKGRTTDGLNTVVAKRAYYYGVGYTGRVQMSVEQGRLEAGAAFSTSSWSSLQERHRRQELATNDVEMQDTYQRAEIWVAYKLARNLRVEASLERIRQVGRVNGDFRASDSETRATGRLIYSF